MQAQLLGWSLCKASLLRAPPPRRCRQPLTLQSVTQLGRAQQLRSPCLLPRTLHPFPAPARKDPGLHADEGPFCLPCVEALALQHRMLGREKHICCGKDHESLASASAGWPITFALKLVLQSQGPGTHIPPPRGTAVIAQPPRPASPPGSQHILSVAPAQPPVAVGC